MRELTSVMVDDWLDVFAASVRAKDYDRGRELFSDDATGFGTVAQGYDGLDDLVAGQWTQVWDRTEQFAFDPGDHRWYAGPTCTVAVRWSSVGTDAAGGRARRGRATLVLQSGPDGRVRAVHSHFSMLPGTES